MDTFYFGNFQIHINLELQFILTTGQTGIFHNIVYCVAGKCSFMFDGVFMFICESGFLSDLTK